MASPEQDKLEQAGEEVAVDAAEDGVRPYIDDDGRLVVPAACAEEYRWWAKGGRSIGDILTELKVSRTVWERYSPESYPEELQKENYPLL